MVVILFFLNSANLICRDTDISKYFSLLEFEITRVDCNYFMSLYVAIVLYFTNKYTLFFIIAINISIKTVRFMSLTTYCSVIVIATALRCG